MISQIATTILIGTVLFTCLGMQNQQRTLNKTSLGLIGPVKNVIEKVAEVLTQSGKNTEKCCSLLYQFTFDREGNAISGAFEMQPVDFGPIEPTLNKKPIYNPQDLLIGEEIYKTDGTLDCKILYTYDQKGNKVEEASYSVKGNLFHKKLFSSDTNHRLIEEISYLFNGTPITKWTYDQYDSYQNCIKRTSWRWSTQAGKSDWEPDSVYYTTITYFE